MRLESEHGWEVIPGADVYKTLGALLPTRDGRVVSNAVLCSIVGDDLFKVVTHAGKVLHINEDAMRSLFHEPRWCQYPNYSAEVLRKVQAQSDEAEGRKWYPAKTFPTPGTPLLLELDDGTRIEGTRPDYVQSYNVDANYRDARGKHLKNVKRWSHL